MAALALPHGVVCEPPGNVTRELTNCSIKVKRRVANVAKIVAVAVTGDYN